MKQNVFKTTRLIDIHSNLCSPMEPLTDAALVPGTGLFLTCVGGATPLVGQITGGEDSVTRREIQHLVSS